MQLLNLFFTQNPRRTQSPASRQGMQHNRIDRAHHSTCDFRHVNLEPHMEMRRVNFCWHAQQFGQDCQDSVCKTSLDPTRCQRVAKMLKIAAPQLCLEPVGSSAVQAPLNQRRLAGNVLLQAARPTSACNAARSSAPGRGLQVSVHFQ